MSALSFRACDFSIQQKQLLVNHSGGTEEDDDYIENTPLHDAEHASVITMSRVQNL